MPLRIDNIDDLMLFAQINKPWVVFRLALNINLFDILDNAPLTLLDLAERMTIQPNHLSAITDILISLNLLKYNANKIANTEVSSKYLCANSRNSLKQTLRHNADSQLSIEVLEQLVKDKSQLNPITHEECNMAMTQSNGYLARKLTHLVFRHQEGVLLDLGCGSGIFSFTACRHNPKLKAICVDKAEVIEITKTEIPSALDERVQFIKSDIKNIVIEENSIDFILLSNILHFFNKPDITDIIQRCFLWLKPTGKLVINDFLDSSKDLLSQCFYLDWLSNGIDFIDLETLLSILINHGFTAPTHYDDDKLISNLLTCEKHEKK